MKTNTSVFLDIRGLRYHCRIWGEAGWPKLFMLHGWMDVSASFQYLVDALQADWQVIAPDWRGYGLSAWGPADSYWFPDYLGDLDRLLARFEPDRPATLIGHKSQDSASRYIWGQTCEHARIHDATGNQRIDAEQALQPIEGFQFQ